MKIVYLTSHRPHLPYLVVSLYTLRVEWSGEVEVHAWPQSYQVVKEICQDARLGITAVARDEPEYRGKNDQFLDKMKLASSLDCDGVYLDADTTIHGDLSPLFDLLGQKTFVCSQWNDWVTTGKRIKGRLEELLQWPHIPRRYVEHVLQHPYPSVNGGVFAFRPDSQILELWHNWTWPLRKRVFICDERVMHLLPAVSPSQVEVVQQHGRYNSSPKHQSRQLKDEDVVIRHYHGDSNVRPQKSKRGFALWYPIYQFCLDRNFGYMQEWVGECNNRWLMELVS